MARLGVEIVIIKISLDSVICLPPSPGHGSDNCEYLIDIFMAKVKSSYDLIDVSEVCNVYRPKTTLDPTVKFEIIFRKNKTVTP